MGKLFGTDGVRGIANTELTPEMAYNLGKYGSYVLTRHSDGHSTKILVGRDTRISGDMLESALVAGILSTGADVYLVGEIPTPAIAYLTRKYGADAGVVISASHNSFEYNGIKFFNKDGFKLSDEIEDEIESYILADAQLEEVPNGVSLGRIVRNIENAENDYVNFAISSAMTDISGLKVAVDCANGASFKVAPEALRRLGVDVITIHDNPDGININDGCGSTHIEKLQKFVCEKEADIGLAFDGDADRLIAVDEKGNIIDGDVIMGLISMHLKSKGELTQNKLIGTVMSNLGLVKFCEKHGIEFVQTKVGDRYVLEKMIETGACIGGEQSGHIICFNFNTTGDGLVSAIALLSVLELSGKKASEIASEITILPQVLLNVKVKNEYKKRLMEIKEVAEAACALNKKYNGAGRLLLRPSGTEPLVRIMIEGQDIDEISRDAQSLANVVEKAMMNL
ncbi:MAG: phosphoglucosamine mutase [Bacillota bacterium]|nr:phosphoglucosamine mutase [Bacillota bacterium]